MAFLLLLLALVPVTLLQGWVLSTLWGWFMVPAFGVPDLSVGYAIGVSLIVSALFMGSKRDDDELLGTLLQSVLQPLLVLGMGWVVHQLIGGA